jgi:hypothetical protein
VSGKLQFADHSPELRSYKNQPRRNEEHEDFSGSFFVSFVSSWLIFGGVIHVAMADALKQ